MLYAYAPAGEVAHWRQELDGSLPRAGRDAPPLPAGARPQRGLPPGSGGLRSMSTRTVGVIMNGVTGRMGTNQHLLRSIVPIIRQGGVRVGRRDRSCPSPCWSGATRPSSRRWRGAQASRAGPPISTRRCPTRRPSVYFDAQTTLQRAAGVKKAIAAGKHVYCEKPTATGTAEALELYRLARDARREARRGAGQAVAARAC